MKDVSSAWPAGCMDAEIPSEVLEGLQAPALQGPDLGWLLQRGLSTLCCSQIWEGFLAQEQCQDQAGSAPVWHYSKPNKLCCTLIGLTYLFLYAWHH